MEHYLFWIVHTLGFWSIAFLLIPLPMLKKLIPFGILGGFLIRFTKSQSLIVFGFAVIATVIDYTAQTHRMINHNNWSILQTFMFGVFSHVFILYLLRFLYKKKDIGAMQP